MICHFKVILIVLRFQRDQNQQKKKFQQILAVKHKAVKPLEK